MTLTLDVSFRNIGWAVLSDDVIGNIVDTGVIKTSKLDKKYRKSNNLSSTDETCIHISHIIEELTKIITKYDINFVVGELPHGGSQNANASKQMGIAVSLVVTYFELKNIPTKWCSPNNVKMQVCGKRDASKEEIMNNITSLFPEYKFPKAKCNFEHIADAIGAYLYCIDN